jgi:NAD(P)H-hydrate epimerase
MIAHAKQGLLTGMAANHTGALALVPVDSLNNLKAPFVSDLELISPQTLHFGKSPRPFDFHKGMAGRVAVVAGSLQYPGAAVLAATGALRGGGGLVTLHVPVAAYPIIASKCPPEIIVKSYETLAELRESDCDAWVIGCGLGPLSSGETDRLMELFSRHPAPAVLDADALNAIAASGKSNLLQSRHILTPHPGEFRRLAPQLTGLDREQAVRSFVKNCPATLLLKGSRTLIANCESPLWCNSTGTPAMAGGGQGDLLSGVIGAGLAQGWVPMEAAARAAWSCGRAAEVAVIEGGESEESLTPSDVARYLGRAFEDWCCSGR